MDWLISLTGSIAVYFSDSLSNPYMTPSHQAIKDKNKHHDGIAMGEFRDKRSWISNFHGFLILTLLSPTFCHLKSKRSLIPLLFSYINYKQTVCLLKQFYVSLTVQVVKIQPAVRKKMAGVHFTTIPYEPSTANRHTKSHMFCINLSLC